MADFNPISIPESLPLESRSEEAILAAVKNVVSQPGVVRFQVDAAEDAIKYWRLMSQDEADSFGISFDAALAVVDMEEYDPYSEEDESPRPSYVQLFEMFEMVEEAGFIPSFILTGRPIQKLRKWIPFSRKAKRIYGIPLHFVETIEEDVLVVCGSPYADADITDLKYAVKVTL